MQPSDKLYQILEDISNHKHSRQELLLLQIQQRLDDALKAYQRSIDDSYNYLSKKDELNVMKKLNRGN